MAQPSLTQAGERCACKPHRWGSPQNVSTRITGGYGGYYGYHRPYYAHAYHRPYYAYGYHPHY